MILVAGAVFFSGCSASTDDDPRELLIGTWAQDYDDGDCDVSVEIALNDNGTFDMTRDDVCDDDDYTLVADGVWDLEGGAIVFRFSDVKVTGPGIDFEPGIKYPVYYLMTDSGKLGLSFVDELFERHSSGSGFYGTWMRESGTCNEYVQITNVGDFAWYEACGGAPNYFITGAYTRSGDMFRVNGAEDFYYRLIGNYYMELIHESQLFSQVHAQ